MTESTSSFEINVHYAVPGMMGFDADVDEACNDILEEYGGERVAGGSGFGQRDSHYAVNRHFSPQELRAIRQKIADRTGVTVDINCEEWPAPTESDPEPDSISTYADDPDEP